MVTMRVGVTASVADPATVRLQYPTIHLPVAHNAQQRNIKRTGAKVRTSFNILSWPTLARIICRQMNLAPEIRKIYAQADSCAEFHRKGMKKKYRTTLVTSEKMLEGGRPRHSKRNERTNRKGEENLEGEKERKFTEDKLFESKIRRCWLQRPCSRLCILELLSFSLLLLRFFSFH